MKNIKLIICAIVLSQFAFSQEIEDRIYHLNILTSVGSGELTNNQFGVMNGNYIRYGLQMDIRLYKDSFLDDVFLSFGLGYSEFSSNISLNNQSSRLKNSYFDAPLMLNFKEYFNKNKSLIFFISGGVSLNYLQKSNLKSISNNVDFEISGFNSGNINRIGIEYVFANEYYFGIAYHDYRDFKKIEKNGISNNLNNVNCINFSVGFRR